MKVATLIYKLLDMILIVNRYLVKAIAFISCNELSLTCWEEVTQLYLERDGSSSIAL